MALLAWQATVQDQAGNAVVNPSVTVRNASDNSLADIFADDDGLTPLANPFTGTAQGFVKFFAAYGRYNIEGALGAETTATWEVHLDDWTGRAEAAAEQAEAEVSSAAVRFYDSVDDFQAATIPALVNVIGVVNADGEMIFYRREPGAVGGYDLYHNIQEEHWAKSSLTNADLIAAVTDIITAGEFPTYAEGAFTPVFTWSDFAAGSVSGGTTSGSFVRQGRMVYIDASFVNITVSRVTDSGTIRIGNLPYPAAANTFGSLHIRRCSGIDLRDTGSAPPMNATIAIAAGQTYGTLTINPANAATFSAGVARCATGAGAVTLQVTGWYEVQD